MSLLLTLNSPRAIANAAQSIIRCYYSSFWKGQKMFLAIIVHNFDVWLQNANASSS